MNTPVTTLAEGLTTVGHIVNRTLLTGDVQSAHPNLKSPNALQNGELLHRDSEGKTVPQDYRTNIFHVVTTYKALRGLVFVQGASEALYVESTNNDRQHTITEYNGNLSYRFNHSVGGVRSVGNTTRGSYIDVAVDSNYFGERATFHGATYTPRAVTLALVPLETIGIDASKLELENDIIDQTLSRIGMRIGFEIREHAELDLATALLLLKDVHDSDVVRHLDEFARTQPHTTVELMKEGLRYRYALRGLHQTAPHIYGEETEDTIRANEHFNRVVKFMQALCGMSDVQALLGMEVRIATTESMVNPPQVKYASEGRKMSESTQHGV